HLAVPEARESRQAGEASPRNRTVIATHTPAGGQLAFICTRFSCQ
ncbi:hypothetical protein LCGC14_1704700, partial [marine sediment metagenome]